MNLFISNKKYLFDNADDGIEALSKNEHRVEAFRSFDDTDNQIIIN